MVLNNVVDLFSKIDLRGGSSTPKLNPLTTDLLINLFLHMSEDGYKSGVDPYRDDQVTCGQIRSISPLYS